MDSSDGWIYKGCIGMGERGTMTRIKYSVNEQFIKPWATRIGKFILNFAGLEFESNLWLIQMSEQPEKIPEFTKLEFAKRVKIIIKYIKSLGFSERWKLESLTKWQNALELAILRNRIAHNPLLFFWNNEIEEGEPDCIGIADMKSGKRARNADGPLLSKADIDNAINQVKGLVVNLEYLRVNWCSIRDKEKNSG